LSDCKLAKVEVAGEATTMLGLTAGVIVGLVVMMLEVVICGDSGEGWVDATMQ